MKKRVAILGSTGSIGCQALDVIQRNTEAFVVEVLTAGKNKELLIRQALQFVPAHVVICDESLYAGVRDALAALPIQVHAGPAALAEVTTLDSVDIVMASMVGFSGLIPTIAAIKSKKALALANKETLVVAGELITRLAEENGVTIVPVDSEHSAIFQCLAGEHQNRPEKIILTASGGPFRGKSRDELELAGRKEALNHPNWCMGDKITIDSATLMNKGLEVIEARWLFDLSPGQIEVVIHPQSVIHSMVQFEDGSIKAQMGLPDMRLPIQYALGYPVRLKSSFPRFSFTDYPQLTFEKPDLSLFRNLQLAFNALDTGGNMPCIMNAANEIVVDAFLKEKVGFLQMSELIEKTMNAMPFLRKPSLEDYQQSDHEAREFTKRLLKV
ncbi:MAG: 1-deoxy-D-xylulose-5-phosphate reductoisomerase [Bacteroidetes bacterium RBG_13_46_8]|nr:MAG: 1-deoxy-D-xylulose-5-phosphate reductoisomerase [Bacteroidetes bacterium RBG_13_46_8]